MDQLTHVHLSGAAKRPIHFCRVRKETDGVRQRLTPVEFVRIVPGQHLDIALADGQALVTDQTKVRRLRSGSI